MHSQHMCNSFGDDWCCRGSSIADACPDNCQRSSWPFQRFHLCETCTQCQEAAFHRPGMVSLLLQLPSCSMGSEIRWPGVKLYISLPYTVLMWTLRQLWCCCEEKQSLFFSLADWGNISFFLRLGSSQQIHPLGCATLRQKMSFCNVNVQLLSELYATVQQYRAVLMWSKVLFSSGRLVTSYISVTSLFRKLTPLKVLSIFIFNRSLLYDRMSVLPS